MKPSALAIDLDGVIYRGSAPVPRAVDSIRTLQNTDIPFCFVTNNSEHHPAHYIDKLADLGIHIDPLQLLSSSHVLAEQLQLHHRESLIHCIGSPGLRTFLCESGLHLSPNLGRDRPDLIVVGEIRHLDYNELCTAVSWAAQGVTIHATNSDRVIPTAQSILIGCGAITQLIAEAAKVEPVYYGKPSNHMAAAIGRRLQVPLEDISIIGDTLETDIRLAVDHGMQSILVLTGNTQSRDTKAGNVQATEVVPSIVEVIEALAHVD